MSILAIPAMEKSLNSTISERFARSDYFYLYNNETGEGLWIENGISDAHGAGIKAVQVLADAGVKEVAAVQLGDNAKDALDNAGICFFLIDKNCKIDEIVLKFKCGNLN